MEKIALFCSFYVLQPLFYFWLDINADWSNADSKKQQSWQKSANNADSNNSDFNLDSNNVHDSNADFNTDYNNPNNLCKLRLFLKTKLGTKF